MSINDQNSNSSTARTAAASRKTFSGQKSLLSLNSYLGAAMSRNANGAALSGFMETMTKIVGEVDKSLKAQVFALDNQSTGLVYSLIALTAEAGEHVAVFQFVVAGSAETRGSRIVKNGNREFEIPRVPSDIYTAQLWDRVSENLTPRLAGKQLHDAGLCVLPVELEHDNIDSVRSIVHVGVSAVLDWLNGANGNANYFNAADFAGAQYRARLIFNGGQTFDAVNQPLRTNYFLQLTGAENHGQDSEIMQNETLIALNRGFINLRYVGHQPIQNPMGMVQHTTQCLMPVINVVSTNIEQDVMTPELHLVSLALSVVLGRNEAWRHSFRPNRGGDEFTQMLTRLDGLTSDLGVPIDTKNAEMFDLNTFLQTWVFPNPIWRLDVEEAGEQTWLNEIIREAARGNSEAYNLLIATANRLTNNVFGTLFPAGTAIGQMEDDRVILGHYRDRNGERRDLREIDKLAIDNMNPADPIPGLEYERTLNPQYAPIEQRISERVSILQQQLQGQMKITGYATGVLLNPDFLMALFMSLEKAGMLIRMDNAYDAERTYDRSQLGLMQFGMNTSALTQQVGGWGNNFNYNPYSGYFGSR